MYSVCIHYVYTIKKESVLLEGTNIKENNEIKNYAAFYYMNREPLTGSHSIMFIICSHKQCHAFFFKIACSKAF